MPQASTSTTTTTTTTNCEPVRGPLEELHSCTSRLLKPWFREPAPVPDNMVLGLKLVLRTTSMPPLFSVFVRVAVPHDISDHLPQVLLAIPIFPQELTDDIRHVCRRGGRHGQESDHQQNAVVPTPPPPTRRTIRTHQHGKPVEKPDPTPTPLPQHTD